MITITISANTVTIVITAAAAAASIPRFTLRLRLLGQVDFLYDITRSSQQQEEEMFQPLFAGEEGSIREVRHRASFQTKKVPRQKRDDKLRPMAGV